MKACISVSPKVGDRSSARVQSWLQHADAEKKNTPSPKGRKNACECQSSALDFARGKPSVPIVQHGLRQADDKAGRYPRAWRRSFQRQVGLSMPPGARRWFWTSPTATYGPVNCPRWGRFIACSCRNARPPWAPTLPSKNGTFGTSRWQLFTQATSASRSCGRGRNARFRGKLTALRTCWGVAA